MRVTILHASKRLMGFAPRVVKGSALRVLAPPRREGATRSPQKSATHFPALARATPTLAGSRVACATLYKGLERTKTDHEACKTCRKGYILVMGWTVEFLDEGVRADLNAMPTDIRSAFNRIVELISSEGLERVREPYVKHLQGRVWEMRLKGKDGIARAAYVTATGRRVVVVHVFGKKTQKTPRRELQTALRRAKEVE